MNDDPMIKYIVIDDEGFLGGIDHDETVFTIVDTEDPLKKKIIISAPKIETMSDMNGTYEAKMMNGEFNPKSFYTIPFKLTTEKSAGVPVTTRPFLTMYDFKHNYECLGIYTLGALQKVIRKAETSGKDLGIKSVFVMAKIDMSCYLMIADTTKYGPVVIDTIFDLNMIDSSAPTMLLIAKKKIKMMKIEPITAIKMKNLKESQLAPSILNIEWMVENSD